MIILIPHERVRLGMEERGQESPFFFFFFFFRAFSKEKKGSSNTSFQVVVLYGLDDSLVTQTIIYEFEQGGGREGDRSMGGNSVRFWIAAASLHGGTVTTRIIIVLCSIAPAQYYS